MSSEEKREKPVPSAEEIAAYVERSAARTKKRLTIAKLPLSTATAEQPKRALRVERKLPSASEARAAQSLQNASATSEQKGEPEWQPPGGNEGD